MKKIIAIIVLLASAESVFAQSTFKPGVGVNFTNISGTADDVSGNIGWQIGASIEFGKKLYFEPGLFYLTENAEASTIDNGVTTFTDAKFSGLRVPLTVGLNVLGNTESTFGLRVFGGSSAFLLTGVSDGLNKDDFNSPKWGVFAGAGIDLALFYLDWSYQWSVTNIQKSIDDIDFGKTNGIFLTAGLRF
ncbi:outer membrane beta-barrel protein [Cyclobacterium xiamenense]|nr:outer membrane beta-barrel protein [Cyclobacterium xiamenense]